MVREVKVGWSEEEIREKVEMIRGWKEALLDKKK